GLDIVYGYEDRVVADGGTIESLQCANIGLRYLKILNDDGTSYQFEVTETFMGGDLAQDRVILFPIGIANLWVAPVSVSSVPLAPDPRVTATRR
ncbi:MAG: hypothetical protein ACO3RE_08995, partial [Ilumatobacteraceae bacterium]